MSTSPVQGVARPEASDFQHSSISEAKKQFGLLHTSLVGMTLIIFVFLVAIALPVIGYPPVTHLGSLIVIFIATLGGIGYLYYLNYGVYKLVSEHDKLNAVLVNSLGQGFLSFGKDGICDHVYSQACLDFFGTEPGGKNIMDVLRVPEEGRTDFQGWVDILFMPDHALGFPDVINFLPQILAHPKKRRITLDYKPIYSKARVLSRVMLIATDVTEEYDAQDLAKKRQEYADMICRIFRERNQFLATITHIRSFLEQAAAPDAVENKAAILRHLHTLKAAVKHFHLGELSATVHGLESELRSDTAAAPEEFKKLLLAGRACIDRGLGEVLDAIKDLIGTDYERRGNTHEIEESALYNFALVMNVSGVSKDVIDHYLRFIVAVPIQDCFRQFERELQDLSEITGKQIKSVRYSGSNPPVLLREYQQMFFSLTHVCRNIVDHGIEPSVTRIARGKDPAGQVLIECDVIPDVMESEKEWLHIVISDDGGGIDVARVREKLLEADSTMQLQNIDDHAIIQNIFTYGISTRDRVTDLSGRGVGMNVVKREVENINGRIEVFSELYRGTRFEIFVPYLLSI
ncbi:MAG: ATP-binding protein [Alphaproteobacteria bacterium]|nr:ATP-binding protein [Alphaproteobacteria bacterium]